MAVPLIPLVVVTVGAVVALVKCGGDDGNEDGHVDHDADAGDINVDGSDADSYEDVPEVDGDVTDGDDGGPNCTTRTWIKDDYAVLPCLPVDIDIINNNIKGLCPSNIFSCTIGADSASCGTMAELPSSTEIDGTIYNNVPTQITDLGDNRVLALYKTEGSGERSGEASGLVILNTSTNAIEQRIALGKITIASGDDPADSITITPRQAFGAVLSGDSLYVSVNNFNRGTGQYEPGMVVVFPFSATTHQIDMDNIGDTLIFFTLGRNSGPVAMVRKGDEDRLAVQNSSGPNGMIPLSLTRSDSGKMEINVFDRPYSPQPTSTIEARVNIKFSPAGPATKGPLPDEEKGANTALVDISDTAYPVENIKAGGDDVWLQNFPEIALSQDKSWAIEGGAVAPIFYKVGFSGTAAEAQLADALGKISSIAIWGSPEKVIASFSGDAAGAYLYNFDFDTPAASSNVYIAAETGVSVFDNGILYLVAKGGCGVSAQWRLVAVNPTEAFPTP